MLFRKNIKVKKSLFRKIVNGFLYFGIGIITALIILFAISQTSTFRDWVKDKVVTTVNGSINGNLSIESIDGTIFTSIILNNTLLMQREDTLFFAGEIELRTSPLELLFKTIYIRKFRIKNASIALLKDRNGVLNLSKLTTPSETEVQQDTVSSSDFEYKIRVADLQLENVSFKMQSEDNKFSKAYYDNLNSDDFRVNNINLSLSAYADIIEEEVELKFKNFSAFPNLYGFYLIDLSGDFLISKETLGLTGFSINTNRSNISINVAMKDFPIWGGREIQIEKIPLRMDFVANGFNFDDLTNFVPATGLLNGDINTSISVRGSLNDLRIRKLNIAFSNTRLNGRGNLKNILSGDKMFIDMIFLDTHIDPDDPNTLLRDIKLPVFDDFGELTFDTLYFKGEPLDFDAGMKIRSERGDLEGFVNLDLTKEDMVYDISLLTQDLDLFSFTNIHTSLNSHVKLKGSGTSPERMNTMLNFTANWSEIAGKRYERLSLNLDAVDGKIKPKLFFIAGKSKGDISGNMNFTNSDKPEYDFELVLNNFNIAELNPGSDLESNINLKITAEGNRFDKDSIEVFAVIGIDSSNIGDIILDDKKVIVDLRNENDGRIINVVSNLADITLTGNFSILDLAAIIQTEANLITDFLTHNLSKINPDTENEEETLTAEYSLPDESVKVDYSIEFKDFQILSLFLGEADLEVDGDINGLISRKGNLLSLSLLMDVNYFQYLKYGELYFTSGLHLEAVLSNDFSVPFPHSFKSEVELTTDELFFANRYHDLNLSMKIEDKSISLNGGFDFEDYISTKLKGDIVLSDRSVNLNLDSLYLKYYDFDVWNRDNVNIVYSDNKFFINSFDMTHNPGDIIVTGHYSLADEHKLNIKVTKLKAKDLSNKILYLPSGTTLISDIDMNGFWQGTADDPLINMNLVADSIKIRDKKLGTLIATASYNLGKLSFDVNILDTLYNINVPILKAEGSIPLNLSSGKSTDDIGDSDISLSLISNDFDLRMIAGAVTPLQNLQGKLNADIEISGNPENPVYRGNAILDDVSFVVKENNIRYNAFVSISLTDENIILDSLYLKNIDGTSGGGIVYGRGTVLHNNLNLEEIDFRAHGQLKILSKNTRAVNPTLYGELTILSNGDIVYTYKNEISTVEADLVIRNGTDVTNSPGPTAFSNSSDRLIYRYKKYYDASGGEFIIDSLLSLSNESDKENNTGTGAGNLNLRIKINVEDEAKMIVELSPEFKQNLIAYLGGGFEYSVVDNIPAVQGELNLLEGSKLDFIKSFDATGTVKFYDEIDNPYLDITAYYRDYYLPISDSVGSSEKEVEIRVKLQGPLKELKQNFARQKGNISVYRRDNALSDFQLDASKTSSDAIMFIIVGKFTDDATSQDKDFAASTAASFAGSIIGGILHENFGDVIRSFRIQQIGTETKFSLIGRVEPFRYEIGGTSQLFQDLSKANIKIEVPPFPKSLKNLVFRLQRRDPFLGISAYSEMINEISLKYKFDF